jgi:ribosomal protein S25
VRRLLAVPFTIMTESQELRADAARLIAEKPGLPGAALGKILGVHRSAAQRILRQLRLSGKVAPWSKAKRRKEGA